MKIVSIKPVYEKLIVSHPYAWPGFTAGFPIEVVEIDESDDDGEKLIIRSDDDSVSPQRTSKKWFNIEYEKNA